MLINYYGRTYEYQFATKALTVSANLNGFLPPIVPLMSQQMLYMHNLWILDIIALEDYSIKGIGLVKQRH